MVPYTREYRDTAITVNVANLNKGLVCKNYFYKCGQNNECGMYDVDVKSKYLKKFSRFESMDIVEKTS